MTYQGMIAEIPVGQTGLTGTRNQALIRPDQLTVARNITYETGTIRKEGGAVKYNSTAITGTPNIIAGYDWWPDESTQRMIVFTDAGNLLKDSGSGDFATTLASGLTSTDSFPMFVEGGKEAAAVNRKLFFFSGKNQVKVLSGDGATVADVATPPADWSAAFPTCGANHEGRIWGGGNSNAPHRLYFSTTTDHEDFTGTGSGTILVYPGEGERIVAIVSFKGLMIVFKFPMGVYLVDTSPLSTSDWRVSKLSGATGTVSPLSWAAIDDDLIFVDSGANFQRISAVTEFGDVQSRNMSIPFQFTAFMRSNINLNRLPECRAVYYPTKREAHFCFAQLNDTLNNARVVWDFNNDAPRPRYSDRDINHTIWLRKEANSTFRPAIGSDAGFVWLLDDETRSKDGAGYLGEFKTSDMDLGFVEPKLATVHKHGQFLEITVEPTGNWDINIDIFWDGVLKHTVDFNMGVTGSGLGSFTLDSDALGGEAISTQRKRITSGGRRFALAGSNSANNTDFSLMRFFLHFVPGDERDS